MTELLPQSPDLPGITWRPARKDDAAGIVGLQDAVFETDGGWREVESEILDRWGSDDCDPGVDSLVAVDDSGSVFVSIWSHVPSVASTKWRAFGENYVHPEYRSPAVNAFVLEWWEARGRERLSGKLDGLGQFYWQLEYDSNVRKIRFLEANGYKAMRYYDDLARDLTRPLNDMPLVDGLTVETWETAPLEDSRTVHNDSFADHWGSQPISEARWARIPNEFHLPLASFVVYDGEAPVGYVSCASYPHDFEDKGRTEAWIEGLGTIKSHRKQGIATALAVLAMKEFVRLGVEYAVLDVDSENPTGAYGLYESLGFVHERRSIAFTKKIHRRELKHKHG
ncbi:MAG: GNAT family N-acetyltransferase [Acidimicrobiia bacterium]|nr:MAG: GNAT family N-acetyltransferase [Acidimicrobiia bacterium]